MKDEEPTERGFKRPHPDTLELIALRKAVVTFILATELDDKPPRPTHMRKAYDELCRMVDLPIEPDEP